MLKHSQRGVTLIELMIGLVVSMIVIAGATAVYVTTVSAGAETVRMARLNQEARAVMDIISSELRRTGYCWPSGNGEMLPECDPALDDPDIVISDGGQCVRYFYQRSDDFSDSAPHVAGFRLDGNTVRMSQSGGSFDDPCSDAPSWTALNDDGLLQVNTLRFSSEGSQCLNVSADDDDNYWPANEEAMDFPCAVPDGDVAEGDRLFESRVVVVRLEASDARDSRSSRPSIKLEQSVKLRNNRIRNY